MKTISVRLNLSRSIVSIVLLLLFRVNGALSQSFTSSAGCPLTWETSQIVEANWLQDKNFKIANIGSLAWLTDGVKIIVVYSDGYLPTTLKVWGINHDQPIVTLDQPNGVFGLSWSPHGEYLGVLSGNGVFTLLGFSNEGADSVEATVDKELVNVVWAPDGEQFAMIGNKIQLWNADELSRTRIIEPHGRIPDLHAVWSLIGLRWVAESEDGTLSVWEANQAQPLFMLDDDYDPYILRLSPMGELLATLGHDGVQIWRLEDGQILQTMDESLRDIVWSPDGSCIVATVMDDSRGNTQYSTVLWDVNTGETWPFVDENTTNSVWSPDGTMLATTSNDGTLRIWGAAGE